MPSFKILQAQVFPHITRRGKFNADQMITGLGSCSCFDSLEAYNGAQAGSLHRSFLRTANWSARRFLVVKLLLFLEKSARRPDKVKINCTKLSCANLPPPPASRELKSRPRHRSGGMTRFQPLSRCLFWTFSARTVYCSSNPFTFEPHLYFPV